ncbi:pantoate--beta-alanine ligase [Pelagibacterales bacterium SAG-MED28]|nr:pantoate--beta-alanine ligase [Pelagibacterales bacterium SAG-MED28]
MKIFKNKEQLKREIGNKKSISFVPTMGGLHKGHISLIKTAKKYTNKTLVSIYVNPKQFNKEEDYKKYPRNLVKDLKILKRLRVNYLYLPTYKDLFRFKPLNKIYLHKFSKILCGKYRKYHFKGVLDVINRFLQIIRPKYLFLGFKDFQQLTLIKKHILKNKIDTKIISCKTVREDSGVAFSSRNFNLNKSQMKIAKNVYDYLIKIKKKIKKNSKLFNPLLFKKHLIKLGVSRIDYLEIINLKSLSRPKKPKESFNIFIAYYLNNVRLIDNI